MAVGRSSESRRIVLHVGLAKTGTTTIQNVLHANREHLLREEGVLYPSLAPNLGTTLGTIFRDDPRAQLANRRRGHTDEEIAAHRERYLASLEAEISSAEWGTLVMSAEGLSRLSATELARLREWGEGYASELLILACVRHPVDWSRSVLQERLKQGQMLRQLYAEIQTPEYRERISKAMAAFGRENVSVFDFESATEGEGGIVGAFARRAGLSVAAGGFLASRALRYNESLSMEAALILDALNRQRPLFVGEASAPARAPRRAGPRHELPYIGRIRGRKFDVPDHVKEDIRARSREDVAWLNETFGLDLYRDVAESAPRAHGHEEPAMEALSEPAVESIAEILGDLVAKDAYRRTLERGQAALERGDLERAERMLREAARLDPDAPQPKRLLEKVAARRTG